MSISTSDCVFLDIKNYVAAGTSYKKWVDSYDIKQTKGIFPYEWFTSLDKLNETELPPKEAFWSALKQRGISDEEYIQLQQMWKDQGFATMRDLLRWYNNLDVEPFLLAAEKLFHYWVDLGIDAFKGNCVSLPGLALAYLTRYKALHTILPLFRSAHQDIHATIRDNIVGGLSVVNHREHEKGVTRLPDGSLVDYIYSLDCNSLYLFVLAKPTRTGVYKIWRTTCKSRETPDWVALDNTDAEKVAHAREEWDSVAATNLSQVFHRLEAYPYGKS